MAGRRISSGTFLGIFLFAMAVIISGSESQEVVMDAYNLRMQGKVQEAKALLEQAISENPDNADAYYELARIEWYQGLGWTEKDDFDIAADLQNLIDKAVEIDPDNVIYAYFAGCAGIGRIYLSFVTGDQPGAKENLAGTIEAFESALELKPDYHQAMLHLVDLCNRHYWK